MQAVTLPNGSTMPRMGQGTWFLGENPAERSQEIEALREGIRRGLTLIDTAEMYGDGDSEKLVGEAISDCRDDVFLVSKVSPGADRQETIEACENSLRRLETDHLDLYLLHGPHNTDFEETLDAFQQLVADGKIRQFGVSNFNLEQMKRFCELPGGENTQVNQLLYNLNQRGIEWDLLSWLQERGFGVMAYSPFDRAKLIHDDELQEFSRQRNINVGQAALAWLLSQDQVIPIPKSSRLERVSENAAAVDVTLTADDLAELDRIFAPPDSKQPLQIY